MISVQVLARDKLALVVGNNSYAGMFDSLNNSVNDARKIAEALKDLDFKVILKLNASQETIELAINEFGDKLTKNAVGLFYFSGHAAQYKDVNYLVPTNFIQNSNKLRYRATPVGFILAEMKKANNGLNIVILDACRNILEEIQDKGYGNAGGLGKMSAISGSVIAYATQPGFKSYEDKTQDNSYYTKHLLRFLKQDGLSLTELFSEVSLAVSKETKGKQEPWTSFLSLPKFCLAGCKLDNDIDKKKLQKQLERERLEKKQLQRQLQELIGSKLGKIAKLLKTCQFRFDNNWLTSGGNGTALDCYKDVLKLDANNFAASQGLVNIENRYVAWAENALKRGKKNKVRQYLASLSLVNPESPKIVELEEQLKEKVPQVGETFQDRLKNGGLAPKMVVIPAGRFKMGDIQGGGYSDEKPVHRVNINYQFAAGKYEVTFAEYDKFAQATGRSKPDDIGWGRGKRPVINVSWNDAVAYTKWLSKQTAKEYRLPSEAEWEYVARAGSTTKYWWGNSIGKNRANCDGCGSRWDDKSTSPIGSFSPNQFGLYDTVGNVWEWCADKYHDNYKNAPTDGRVWGYATSNKRRVLRGGSWNNYPLNTRSAGRSWSNPDYRDNNSGFRVFLSL